MDHHVPWASKERRTSFLEPVRASTNVWLVEIRPEMQKKLNIQRQRS